jgi:hypothetical protein
MNEIKLSIELVNSILQYLGSQPYVEVVNLIAGIQKQATEQGLKPIQNEEVAEAQAEPEVLTPELVNQ